MALADVPSLGRCLRAQQVAALLGVSEARCYELMRTGILPSVRLGRQVRVHEEVLREWIRNGGQTLPGGGRRRTSEGVTS